MKLSKTTLLVAAIIVVVSYLLGLIVNLPGWAAVFAAIVILLVLALFWREPQEKPVPVVAGPTSPATPKEREPVFEGPPSRTVTDVRLPTASPDYDFSFAAIVQWSSVRPGTRHADLGSVAVNALIQRARSAVADWQPGEESVYQHRLAALLGEPAVDAQDHVRSWATEVRLRLPEADAKHLQHIAVLRRREQTILLERRLEQGQRAYLRDDVLATPGSAVVWWLANNPGEVEKCVELLDTLTRLSAAAHDRHPPDLLLDNHDDLERVLQAYSLADLQSRFTHRKHTERIHDLHDPDQPQAQAIELMPGAPPPLDTAHTSTREPPTPASQSSLPTADQLSIDDRTTDGHAADQRAIDGHAADDHAGDGHAADGHATGECATDGRADQREFDKRAGGQLAGEESEGRAVEAPVQLTEQSRTDAESGAVPRGPAVSDTPADSHTTPGDPPSHECGQASTKADRASAVRAPVDRDEASDA